MALQRVNRLGTASVEMVFDNSDGKIGGAYASL